MDTQRLSLRKENGSAHSLLQDQTGLKENTMNIPRDSSFNSIFGPSEVVDDAGTDRDFKHESHKFSITRAMPEKLAGKNIAPFLAKHIPEQYAPLGSHAGEPVESSGANSRYCYRHRPDLKCRRQADEPTMDKLQRIAKELETLPQRDQQGIAHAWSIFSAAPAKHRKLLLQGIMAQCCFPQLSFISASVRDLIRIDFLTALPPEISFKILCYLDTTSLCKAAQVSRRWRALADDDVVWHRMCEQHIHRKCKKCGWGLPLLDRKRLRESKRQIELRAATWDISEQSTEDETGSPAPESASSNAKRKPESDDEDTALVKRHCTSIVPRLEKEKDGDYFITRYRPWKEVYKDRFKVGTNWKYGRCSVKVFKGHTNGIMCLQFEDNILATGSYDATIKIWDTETGEELRTLRGHESGIRCLQFDDTKLISGSMDRSLKVWNWRTGECISTYTGHRGGVIGLHFDATILASASVDKTVKIWNFEDKSTCLLRGHTDWVNAVRVDTNSRTVFSASDDCTIRLWDLDTKTCIRTFHGHVGQVQQVIPLPREFEFEDHDAECENDNVSVTSGDSPAASPRGIPGLDAGTSETQSSPFGPAFDNGRPAPPRYIVTSALDSTIRLWETSTGRCLRTFFGHLEGVWALAADTLRIVSGAEDRMVKIWDPRTGKCERTFTGHSGPVTCIGLGDSRFATGSEDCEVRMYGFQS
ncbi:F-box/WD repeat-containing protein [Aspergillus clavatus NRRL 1]|uniref:Probable E3 ubiquitin ligase complex SCF subunit sconB n=1 Tax=Aspergillus clavatus (strain ATCC 1007 / CBS 513.65 / DSM 816 / NCTC 3887 / NRRL 1 / QM 1276 / 107) TaxID=344612 RepID=SCONB_ASPCL|nr:sulfur metabolite repression control protein SconB, putative [Aspergillus clavatus NRRL 1]A1C7E4.1 RecName: Full=Probable E3 ubiquitin ligase complex SCF subunit sconB; AltName: Full=Sulfur controller B; AltName: Full=Sulfur metabolite repression control protein B [Aspergillus clavatus NRRL 1]EAW14315.1 sulfur metabolite repression control protein SconB, putative [Aspergillus clavatus NRRL 1]